MDVITAGFVILALAVVAAGWLIYQLFVQNGRILLRLEALERRLAEQGMAGPAVWPESATEWETTELDSVVGLPPGSVVLDFDLPTLAGERVTLSQWRGRRILLIFFDPQNSLCRQML